MEARRKKEPKAKRHFRSGDLVRLKSGGPRMVVEYLDEIGHPKCAWFDEKGQAHDLVFYESTLVWDFEGFTFEQVKARFSKRGSRR